MSRRASGSRLVKLMWMLVVLLAALLGAVVWWPDAQPTRTAPGKGSAPRCDPSDPCLALVIDDVGRDLKLLQRFLGLETDITYAVLPHAPYTKQSIEALRGRKREYLLHLPMAPQDVSKVTREPVVVGMDGRVGAATRECMARVPGATGANNHMGSALSTDPRKLALVLSIMKKNKLWFLDSKTAKDSIICRVARKLRVACRQRDVFLDDPPSQAAVLLKLENAVDVARKRGWAIAIGHPREATFKVVRQFTKNPQINVVRLSTVFARSDAT